MDANPEQRVPVQSAAATRKDVARLAGTSTAVVSYVVNGGPRPVAAATRDRVLEAIARLDYRPNHIARALRSRRSSVIGLIVPDSSNSFFSALAHAIEALAYIEGYALLVGNTAGSQERESQYLQAFSSLQIDGLILVSCVSQDELAKISVPLVVVDRAVQGVQAATILVDNEAGGHLGTRHLLEHGHGRVACLAGPSDLTPSSGRRRGWARAMSEAGFRPKASSVPRSPFTPLGGYIAARQFLRSTIRPTALFASTDAQALGVLRAAAEADLFVPDDLAIVSFDGTQDAAYTVPGLTTVRQPIELIAERAIQRLLGRIEAPQSPPTSDLLPVALTTRGSCGCPELPPVHRDHSLVGSRCGFQGARTSTVETASALSDTNAPLQRS